MTIKLWGILFLFIFCSACFGTDRSGGVVKYSSGTAVTGKGKFTVLQLPPPWKPTKVRLKQLVHENDVLQATIVTDALCGEKFDDAPLPKLAEEMFRRLNDYRVEKGKKIILDDREAWRLRGAGTLDGVPIKMDVVVMKKDFCLYDFAYFSFPENFSKGLSDFEDYLNGFRTQ